MRREENATELDCYPGLRWHYKIDGKLTKHAGLRQYIPGDKGLQTEVRAVTLGDVGFADDTGLVGKEDEVREDEAIFIATLGDWEEKDNQGKTERLRIRGQQRVATDARGPGEEAMVKNVRGWLDEGGRQNADTEKNSSESNTNGGMDC